MENNEQKRSGQTSSGRLKVGNSAEHRSKISSVVEQVHTARALRLLSSVCQLLLGMAVIILALTGRIRPHWASVVLTMLASAASLLGGYAMWTTLYDKMDSNRLLREAMRRTMDAKN